MNVNINSVGTIRNEEQETIGLLNYTDNIISKIEIDKEYQGQKYGRYTIQQFMKDCNNLGYDEIYILAVMNDKLLTIINKFNSSEVVPPEAVPSSSEMLKSKNPHYKINIRKV